MHSFVLCNISCVVRCASMRLAVIGQGYFIKSFLFISCLVLLKYSTLPDGTHEKNPRVVVINLVANVGNAAGRPILRRPNVML